MTETAMTWTMHAHRYEDGRFHTIGSESYVRAHGLKDPVVRVLVEEVPEDDPSATHWGWMGYGYLHYSPDTEPGMEKWLEVNTEYAKNWPNITQKKESPPDAKDFEGEEGKFEKYFSPKPGSGD